MKIRSFSPPMEKEEFSVSNTNNDIRKTGHNNITLIINKFGVFFMILVLAVIGMMVSPHFLSGSNLLNILNAVSYLGIVAAGISFVIFCGQYGDLSAPMVMATTGVLCVEFMRYGLWYGILAGMIGGVIIGLINGFVIGKLRVNAIIWTLAMNFILEGLVRFSYKGTQIYPDMATEKTYTTGFFLPLMAKLDPHIMELDLVSRAAEFNALATTYPGGVPLVLYIMFAVMIIGYIVMTKSTFGNQLKVVGSSFEVGKMSGINATRTVMFAFMMSSLFASIAGIFMTSLNQVGAFYIGQGYDFQAVTAIILGGMSLSGGRGSMIGVFGGVFTLGLISNILTLFGVGTFTQKMITGVIFITVVAVNARSLRKLGRDYA
ncbi:ABC transporter permease [Oceanispirochaeta sp. M1]|nr:ABC transporter permease [Oceanispirochaeta sp. M1]